MTRAGEPDLLDLLLEQSGQADLTHVLMPNMAYACGRNIVDNGGHFHVGIPRKWDTITCPACRTFTPAELPGRHRQTTAAATVNGPPDLEAVCGRCKRRHLAGLPCWWGRYAHRFRAPVFARYGTDCWLCGHPGADSVDHVTPRSRGGTDALENMRPAHLFCNTGRGAAYPRPAAGPPTPPNPERNDRW